MDNGHSNCARTGSGCCCATPSTRLRCRRPNASKCGSTWWRVRRRRCASAPSTRTTSPPGPRSSNSTPSGWSTTGIRPWMPSGAPGWCASRPRRSTRWRSPSTATARPARPVRAACSGRASSSSTTGHGRTGCGTSATTAAASRPARSWRSSRTPRCRCRRTGWRRCSAAGCRAPRGSARCWPSSSSRSPATPSSTTPPTPPASAPSGSTWCPPCWVGTWWPRTRCRRRPAGAPSSPRCGRTSSGTSATRR